MCTLAFKDPAPARLGGLTVSHFTSHQQSTCSVHPWSLSTGVQPYNHSSRSQPSPGILTLNLRPEPQGWSFVSKVTLVLQLCYL